jgi:hypothetical protein
VRYSGLTNASGQSQDQRVRSIPAVQSVRRARPVVASQLAVMRPARPVSAISAVSVSNGSIQRVRLYILVGRLKALSLEYLTYL